MPLQSFRQGEVGGFREVSVGDLQVVRRKSGKKSGWEEEESSRWAAWWRWWVEDVIVKRG